ncbi:MAG TPA: energy transducer TonB [Gammaproteobacteria bacterium]
MLKIPVDKNPARVIAIFLLLPICLAGQAQQSEEIKDLVRQASKECREAKLQRRSNLQQAQDHFKAYVELLNRAIAIQPDLLDNPDSDTQRVLDFCNVVKSDLDRAVALPLFERGIRECGEARVLISNAAFDEAREKYKLYREYKEGALVISDSVLQVHENSYEIHLCDRLGEDIAQAEAEYQKQLRQAAVADRQDAFQDVLDSLAQADRQCRGARDLINDKDSYNTQTIAQVEALAGEAAKIRDAAVLQRDKLLAGGQNPSQSVSTRISAALTGIQECQGAIPSGLARVKATLVAKSNAAGSGAAGSKASQVNQEIRQIVGAPADYPRRALRRNIEGSVLVSFTVTKSGDVTDIQVVEADPAGYFEESVIEAVEKYKFQPRIVNGNPVETQGVSRRVVFKLQ